MNQEIESLGSIGGALAAATFLFAAAYGVGGLLVWPATAARDTIDRRLLRIAVGLSLVAGFGAALGMAKWLTGGRSLGLVLALTLLNALSLRRRSTAHGRSAQFAHRRESPWLAAPVFALALITLGPALAYPTGWDELVYHSVLPRRWLADGWPAFYADLPYSGFPSLGEILFWLVAPVESVIAPRLITWTCWILSLVMTYRLLRRSLAAASAATLMLVFALSETVLLISANCYVEAILMMNVAAMLLAMERHERERQLVGEWRHAAILGVLGGGAAAVKLTGLAVLVVPCLWYLGRDWRDRRFRFLVPCALYVTIASVTALPFYLRPWLLTGNPLYPYYAEWFTADPARLEMSRYHHGLGAAFGLHSGVGFFAAPVLLAYDSLLYDGSFGWQLLIFIALAALAAIAARDRPRIRPFVLWPAVVAGWFYLFWNGTAQQARFAIPAILGLLLLAAIGLRRFHGNQRKLVLAALLAAALISGPWRTAGHYFGSWLSALHVISRTDYLNVSTEREYLPLIQAVAEHTPPDARLMLLFEHRGFYLPRPHVIGTPFFQEAGFTPPEQFKDIEKIMDLLGREQITHVITTNKPTGPDKLPAWLDRLAPFFAGLRQCVDQGRLHVIWESERYVLLEVQL
jgi:hypothetical protein